MTIVLELPGAIRQRNGEWTKEIELDEMSGYEEDILASEEVHKKGPQKGRPIRSPSDKMSDILSSCTVRIGSDVRPSDRADRMRESFDAGYFRESWKKAFVGDRGFMVVQLRMLSLGAEFKFSEPCPKCDRQIENHVVRLDQLEEKRVTIQEIERVANGVESKTPKGMPFTWQLLTGEHEVRLSQVQDEFDSVASALMALRLSSINNSPVSVDNETSLRILKRLPMSERIAIRQHFDSVEFGTSPVVELACGTVRTAGGDVVSKGCGFEWKRLLPLEKKSFFFPSAT